MGDFGNSAGGEWTKHHRLCAICLPGKGSYAELVFESALWKFYYCSTGGHWFQASAADALVTQPISSKRKLRALGLLYTEQKEEYQALYTQMQTLRKIRRAAINKAARLHLKLSRLLDR